MLRDLYDRLYNTIISDASDYDKAMEIDRIIIPALVVLIDKDYEHREFVVSKIKEYQQKGLFKHTYHASFVEVKERLERLNSAYDIINSDASDYCKLEQLLRIFKSSTDFKKQFYYMVKLGSQDPRLEIGRVALDNFADLYTKFKDYESKCSDIVKYTAKKESYYQNYQYAKFVVTKYIESGYYKESIIFSSLGIDKDIFNFCVATIEETDVDLYKQYLAKQELNNKIRFVKNREQLLSLINDMKLAKDKEFDLIEFLRRVPFTDETNMGSTFAPTLFDFVQRVCPEDYEIIKNYIYGNKLHSSMNLKPLQIYNLYNTKTVVNGVEVTNSDIQNIFRYLKVNNIPLISKTYSIILSRYMNGEITPDMIQEQCNRANMKFEDNAVVIPSKRK